MMILSVSIFATEVVWSSSSAINANEYNKIIKEYVDKTYPQEVQEYKKYLKHRYDNQIDKGTYIQPAMVYIEAGSFMMGSNYADNDEIPVHKVTINYNFYMGKYEVTFAEYDKFCEDTGRDKPNDMDWGREDRPVINVSWEDAKAYTIWLSKKTGKKFRLPSEAEWEYVARAGTSMEYSFGNFKNSLNSHAWYKDNSNNKTHKIGQKESNLWGVYDMHGNVYEWCEDWYQDNYINVPKDGTSSNNGSHKFKVLRGASWGDDSKYLRSADRNWFFPNISYSTYGFRLLLED